jgi:hypothetical protein
MWNRFFFERFYNFFDVAVIMMVVWLCERDDTWMWMLLYIPAFIISGYMSNRVERRG